MGAAMDSVRVTHYSLQDEGYAAACVSELYRRSGGRRLLWVVLREPWRRRLPGGVEVMTYAAVDTLFALSIGYPRARRRLVAPGATIVFDNIESSSGEPRVKACMKALVELNKAAGCEWYAISRARPNEVTRFGLPRAVERLSDGALFPSISAAARAAGVSRQAVSRAVRDGTVCAGSRWGLAGDWANPHDLGEEAEIALLGKRGVVRIVSELEGLV